MKRLLRFLGSKFFLKNIGIAVLITVLLMWLIMKLLNVYTLHGKSIVVPDLSGVEVDKIDDFLDGKHLKYQIIDSLYSTTNKRGTVINQDPKPNVKVKKNRTIYLTVIARLPEKVKMPELKDNTLRQAIAKLETYGLKIGNLKYVPDIAKNTVLEQKFNGEIIEPGTSIEKGSKIDLLLGKGLEYETVRVPQLFGKTRNEALLLLKASSLNVGLETFENDVPESEAIIYKQAPQENSYLKLGDEVDLWYQSIDYFDQELENEDNDNE